MQFSKFAACSQILQQKACSGHSRTPRVWRKIACTLPFGQTTALVVEGPHAHQNCYSFTGNL
eukprot:6434509-Karenia_brevis.AAC.1